MRPGGRPLRRLFLLFVILLCPTPASAARGPAAPARTRADSLANARALTRWAWEAIADTAVESRQRAARDIEQAIGLDPAYAEPWLALGRLQEQGDFRLKARDSYRRAILLDPRSPEGYMALGLAWKREFLRTLNRAALAAAAAVLDTVTRLRPYGADGWLRLAPLRYEQGDLAGAATAAERALAGRPRRPAAPLAVAALAYRRGEIERAESLFVAAVPRLDPTLRALFDRPSWTGLGETVSLRGDPWAGTDPDPTTPQNEARLEYWTRTALAYLLFFDPLRPGLDARAEVYARYGPPRSVELNPHGVSTTFRFNRGAVSAGAVPGEYPFDVMVWNYPELGMRIPLLDRSLTGTFTSETRDPDPLALPDRRLMAGRQDLLSLGGGQMVIPTLPPREQRLDVEGVLARFEGGGRPRLLAQVQAPGSPGDTLWARWTVRDSAGRELARDARAFAVSACDPVRRRVAEFSAVLPPGACEVVVSAHDTHRRRGLFRATATLAAPPVGLALSDLVLTCGDPSLMVGSGGVRLEANVAATVSGRQPLSVYFEIYRLAEGHDGLARFEYEYVVRRVPKEPTGLAKLFVTPEAPLISATTRQAEQVGGLRRQFVSVPTQSLEPGRYRLEIRVTDLMTGAVATGTTEFARE